MESGFDGAVFDGFGTFGLFAGDEVLFDGGGERARSGGDSRSDIGFADGLAGFEGGEAFAVDFFGEGLAAL